jgi:hypothetical protein
MWRHIMELYSGKKQQISKTIAVYLNSCPKYTARKSQLCGAVCLDHQVFL